MLKLQTIVIVLCLWILLTACQVLSLPTGEPETDTAITASPTTVAVVETSTITRLPSLAPTTIQATATPIEPSPTSIIASSATLTPTVVADAATQLLTDTPTAITPTVDTTEPTPEFQVIEAQFETDDAGQTQLSLPITLNQNKLQKPVQALIYLTTNPLDDHMAETTIWQVNPKDINKPTAIISLQHLKRIMGANNPALSPNGKFLVYGRGYSTRSNSMEVVLLNLNNGTEQIIDKGNIVPSANSPIFFWSADNHSITYAKVSDSWDSTELYQYALQSSKTEILFIESNYTMLVGRNGAFVYYIPMPIPGPPYKLSYFNLETKQAQEILTLNESYAVNYVTMSPDKTQLLFTGILVNLQAKTQLHFPSSFSQSLWFPDSAGLISAATFSTITTQQSWDDKTVSMSLNLPTDNDQFVSWSPDSQYLVYRTKPINNQTTYYLLDVFSGQVQQFPVANIFQISGWVP